VHIFSDDLFPVFLFFFNFSITIVPCNNDISAALSINGKQCDNQGNESRILCFNVYDNATVHQLRLITLMGPLLTSLFVVQVI
jgi:hypothetical protein